MSRSARRGSQNRRTTGRRAGAESARSAAKKNPATRRPRVSAATDAAASAAAPAFNFTVVAQAILGACKRLVGATSGYVALSSADGRDNEVAYLDAGEHECTVNPELPMPIRGLREIVYRSARTAWENDFPRTEHSKYLPEGHSPVESVMFAPLPVGGEVVGLLGLANKPGGFSEADSRIVSLFGELAAVALVAGQRLSRPETAGARERERLEQQISTSVEEIAMVSRALVAEVAERTRVEKSLAESGALLRLVLDTLPVGVWVADREGKLTMSNPAGRRIWGGAKHVGIDEYKVYKGWWPGTGAPVEPHEWNMARAITRGETSLDEVIEIEALDGARKTILASAVPIRGAAGEIVGGLAVNHDITDRWRADKALESERNNLRNILNAMDDGVVIIDADDRVQYANPAITARFGPSEGRACYEYLHGEKTPCPSCHKPEVQAGRSVRCERMHTADGRIYEVFATPVTSPDGATSTLEILHDITKRKRIESELRESRLLIQRIADTTPDILYVYDLARRAHTYINRRLIDVLGYPPDAFAEDGDERVSRIAHPEDREIRAARFARLAELQDGELVETEYRIRRADGEYRWLQVRDTVFSRSADGAVQQIVGVARDITDMKRVEHSVLEASEAERRRIGQDLHDGLGQVLAGVALLGKRLERQVEAQEIPDPADMRRLVHVVVEAMEETKRLASGLFPAALEAAGLRSALEDLARTAAAVSDVSCTVAGVSRASTLAPFQAIHFFRIAQEAVHNAIRHGRAKTVTITLHESEEESVLEVLDDGVGIGDDALREEGIGLRSMAYRARLIGAPLDIRRHADGGTILSCRRRAGRRAGPGAGAE